MLLGAMLHGKLKWMALLKPAIENPLVGSTALGRTLITGFPLEEVPAAVFPS